MKKSKLIKTLASISATGIIGLGVTAATLTSCGNPTGDKSLTISSSNDVLTYDAASTTSGTITATNFTLGDCTLTGSDASSFDLVVTSGTFTLTRKSLTLPVADYTITITDNTTKIISNPLTIHIQNAQQQLGGDFSPLGIFGVGDQQQYTSSAGTTAWSFVGSAPGNNITLSGAGLLAWTAGTPANTYSFIIQSEIVNYAPATLNITLTINVDANNLIADATWFAGYPAVTGWQAGKDAEAKATGYSKIIFPADVTSITGLLNSASMTVGGTISEIQIEGTNTSIGSNAFNGCANLVDVDASLSVGSIGTEAFSGCVNLASFSSKSTSIGDYAFSGCASLDVDASSFGTLTSIGSQAFDGCASLTTTGVKALNVESATYTKSSSTNGVVICKTADTYAYDSGCLYVGDISGLTIPTTVASIGSYAFSGCASLTKISSSVTSIGSGAFYGCASLDVDASSFGTLTSIGSDAFYGCASLTANGVNDLSVDSAYTKGYDTDGAAIYKTASTTAYADGCLYVGDISKLTSIPLQNTAASIGTYAFNGCASLTRVTFTSLSSTSIGSYAFYGCANLIYIDFGSITTASIGDYAFDGCDQPTGTIAATTHAGAVAIRDAIATAKSNFANWSVYPIA